MFFATFYSAIWIVYLSASFLTKMPHSKIYLRLFINFISMRCRVRNAHIVKEFVTESPILVQVRGLNWKLIWKKFFSQISSGNLKFPQKSILARLTTFYGQRLNIITFQWPGTIFDMWEPIPKHFHLYLKDMPTWNSNIKSRHDKRKFHQLFSTFSPKTS